MQVLIDDNIPRDAWRELLLNSDFSTPFQTVEFYDFFNSVTGYSAIALAVEDSGKLCALVVATIQKENGIKGYFSKRAIIYGGPVLHGDWRNELYLLLNELNHRLRDKVIYIQIRNFHDYSYYKEIFLELGWLYEPYLNFRLNCTSQEIVFNQLNNNRKRQIKKAIKNGVAIKEATSMLEVHEFYEILKHLYVHRVKKPLPHLTFFESFYNQNIGKYLIVLYKDRIVGGIMCPMQAGKAIYEFYIAGLDKEYKDISPSVMATWAAIEYGYKNGFQYFDFMGAGKPNHNYGVRDFKEKFGGVLVEHGRYLKILNKPLYNLGKIYITLKSKG